MGSVLGVIILVADIWAIIKTVQSPVTGGTKALWVILILVLPVIGLVLWLFLGPRALRAEMNSPWNSAFRARTTEIKNRRGYFRD